MPALARDDGPTRMRALAAGLPGALRDGFRAGREIAPPANPSAPVVVGVGMGGSGISTDLARGMVEAETPALLSIVRSPDVPRAVGPQSHVILVSYSGNTWETLRAYAVAGRVGAHRTVVTSGGALAERAAEDGVPILTVPPGLPPRAAVGHLLGGLLGLLDPWFPESNEARIARVADHVGALLVGYARPRGPAAVIAEKIGPRLPFVYAESAFLALARRWKTQIEENAKRLAVFDEVPELFHNAIVGWDATPRSEASRCAVVLLEWSEESPLVRKSLRYLERLVTGKGARVVRVPLAHEDRLEALVAGIALGDHVSLFLAERRKVDPLPVEAILRLKTNIAADGKTGR
jgi:glucose/mannose-6-phosphate isomerase